MTAALGILFGAMVAFMAVAMPVFLALAFAAVAYAIAFRPAMPAQVVVQTFVQGLDNIAFTAIPYFFAVGTIMNAGGMSQRLLRLARAVVGSVRGGLSHANVAANVVFAGVSGSAVADAAAVGSIMIPAMRRDGYSAAYAAAVTAAAATIGPIIPPSIPMVIFGLFTGASVSKLFIGGIVPGLLMGVFLIATTWLIARRRNYPAGRWQGWRELWRALAESLFALLMPVLVIAGLLSGVATASEIGALACVYATVVTLFVYREIDLAGLWSAIVHAALDAARVLIIVAVSGAFIWIVASIGVGPKLADILKELALGPMAIVALIAAGLVIAGTIVEPIILLVVIVPILVPPAVAAGADLIHLGVVAVLATCIGLVLPPVGILIYMTAAQAEATPSRVTAELVPFIIALCLLLALLVVHPPLVTWLVGLAGR
jgi:tripartite ATP-independent transporter DctM subunit